MAAPIFIAEYESAWNTSASPKSVSVTTGIDDWLFWIAATRDSGTTVNTLNAGTGMTWAFPVSKLVASSCGMYIGAAQATTAETFTLTATATSATTVGQWGFNCLRFSDCNGPGAGISGGPTTGIPSVSITTTQANSTIIVINADWNAIDGSARTWLANAGAFSELTYFRQSLGYTVYGGGHQDAGVSGAKVVGLSNISGQKYVIGALEVLGKPTVADHPPQTNRRKRIPLLVR